MTQPLRRIEDQYEVLSKIREGGMGEIYKVRHRLLDEVRVVKVLRPQHEGDPELAARFAQEARAAIRLRHPNIVQLFDFTLDDSGTGLMMMEFIEGMDLKAFLASPKRASIDLGIEVARQALGALGYLHRNGFVHRDVSPDNIMLSRDFDDQPLVKLIDLGIAKQLDGQQRPELTATGAFLGKFRYASPEHFGADGLESVDHRSDLYSFGLVFYELLTGQFPFAAASTSQLIAAHLYGSPTEFDISDPDGRIPPQLRRLVLKTLSKSPDDRYPTAQDLITCLNELDDLPDINLPNGSLTAEILAITQPDDDSDLAASDLRKVTAIEDAETMEASSTELPVPRSPTAPEAQPNASLSIADGPDLDLADSQTATGEQASTPAVASFETLIKGAQEALRQGDFDTADEILEEAAHQKGTASERQTKLEHLTRKIKERRGQIAMGGTLAVAEVEKHLGKGALLQADRSLFQAIELFGATPALSDLRRRLDSLHHKALERDLQGFVDDAQALAARNQFGHALDLVLKARAVCPDKPWAEHLDHLTEEIEVQIRARREELIEAARQRLAERIDALDYPGARQVLAEMEPQIGTEGGKQTLKKHLLDLYLEGINQRASQAAEAFGAGDFELAVTLLQQALRLNPDNGWVTDRLRDAQERLDLQQQKAPAEVQLAAELATVTHAVDRDDLIGAQKLLGETENRWRSEPRIVALRERVERRVAEELRSLLTQAVDAQSADDFLKARLLVARALELKAENPDAKTLRDALDQNLAEESSIDSDLVPSLAEVRGLLDQGKPLEAWKAVRIAIESFGDREDLLSLQRQIANDLLTDED